MVVAVDKNLVVSLQRAEELLTELKTEYTRALNEKAAGERAAQLTHEVLERLRSVLDRVARRYWSLRIAPDLSEDDQKRASVYFPISADKHDFDSVLGRWRWKSVRDKHNQIYDYLLGLQPFHNAANSWLKTLNDLAVQGKHIDLVPQKRIEERRTTVAGPSGYVSWGPGVTFGSGVSVMGAPIDPRSQRIVPTAGVTEKVEVWVSFMIEGYGVHALGFCEDALRRTRPIIEQMTARFGL